jgi:hypothetical protein
MRATIGILLLSSAAWAQAPKITSFVTLANLDTNAGPGPELVIFGSFARPTAGRDYTITVAGQTTGINVAANGVFLLATVPPTSPSGAQTLSIGYPGQPSNALSIQISVPAPGNDKTNLSHGWTRIRLCSVCEARPDAAGFFQADGELEEQLIFVGAAN